MIHIGFTGTREGLSPAQAQALADVLHPYATAADWAFHHGDCLGADAEAHQIAWRLGAIVHVHPPTHDRLRAYCAAPSRVVSYAPRPYLERNQAIVDACEMLIAAPQTLEEVQRSGTWSAVRYARKRGKVVHILAPERSS